MAERAPVDQYNVPYPLLPIKPQDPRADRSLTTDHNVYQSNDPALDSEAGTAFVMSGCREVEEWLHHLKHDIWPDGLERFPEDSAEFAKGTLWQASGYTSREAWDLSDPDAPKMVILTADQHTLMRREDQYHIETKFDPRLGIETSEEARRNIGFFFAHFALEQLEPERIEAILYSRPSKRWGAAIIALREGAQLAFGPMNAEYRKLLKRGRIRPGVTSAVQAALSFMEPRHTLRYFAQAEEVFGLRAAHQELDRVAVA